MCIRDSFWTRIGGGQAEFFEIGDFVGLDCQLGTAAHEGEDLDPVIEQWPTLMERELVELQVALQVEQQANEGLAEGAGPDDVHDAFGTHLVSSSRWRVCILQGSGAHCTEGTAAKASRRAADHEAGRGRRNQHNQSTLAMLRQALSPHIPALLFHARWENSSADHGNVISQAGLS